MKSQLILLSILLVTVLNLDNEDKIIAPGMPDAVIYSGFLNTLNANRKLHYVFVESQQNPSQAPLTIWLNGGPGCSSLIGFLQQIGPYIIGNSYKDNDNLTKNQYRWNKVSNLLFIESPGIVGFSTDKDYQYEYTDSQTADDAFEAIKYFIFTKAKQFSNRQLFITGQSYAGKYIPDISVRILHNNMMDQKQYINLKGILIGNGVMDFRDQSITKSSIQFMIEHDFFSQRLLSVYRTSCQVDYYSPRCKYFRYQFSILRKFINHYNVYEVCTITGKSIQQIRLQQAVKQLQANMQKYYTNQLFSNINFVNLKQINQCPSDQGMIDYLNLYKASFKVNQVQKNWTVCSDIKYQITPEGSMDQYRKLFLNKAVKIWLYNGDWDDVVPYPDTLKNLAKLRRDKIGYLQPWFTGEHHAGFYQLYDSLTLITVKGASHMVPQTKARASYQMFYNFIKNKKINTDPQK